MKDNESLFEKFEKTYKEDHKWWDTDLLYDQDLKRHNLLDMAEGLFLLLLL